LITECVMWAGRMVPTYQDEIDDWVNQSDSISKSIVRPSELGIDDIDWDHPCFIEGGLFGDVNILILDAQQWPAAMAQKVLKTLDNMVTPMRVGMVFAGGEPSKNTITYATEDVRERFVPYDPDDMAKWMVEWLRHREVTLSTEDATTIAEHVGEDVDRMVVGIISLANTYAGSKVKLSESMHFFGGESGADAKRLISCIQSADSAEALNILHRLVNQGGQNLYGLTAMIIASLRPLIALSSDKNVDLDALGVGGYRQHYVQREARSVSKGAGLAIQEVLSRSEGQFFGGSKLSERDIVTGMILSLCHIFKDISSRR